MSYILVYSPALNQNEIDRLSNLTIKKDVKIVGEYNKKFLKILFDNHQCNIDMHDMIVLKIRDKKALSTICLANNNLQIALKLSKELDVALKNLPELMSSLTNTLIEVNSFHNCIKTVEDLNVQLNLKLQKQNINFKEIVKRATANAASATNHYDNMVRNAKCYLI